tara:strand:+ start:940 stop:1107 length:168 start_codon:yes stop_codon:yes gene_type:complete
LDPLEELCCELGFVFGIGGKVNTRAAGVEWLDQAIFEVTGEDESAVATKFLNKRP